MKNRGKFFGISLLLVAITLIVSCSGCTSNDNQAQPRNTPVNTHVVTNHEAISEEAPKYIPVEEFTPNYTNNAFVILNNSFNYSVDVVWTLAESKKKFLQYISQKMETEQYQFLLIHLMNISKERNSIGLK